MPHLIDARALLDVLKTSDPQVPHVVFNLLGMYFEQGPFEFNASILAERLSNGSPGTRLNPQILATMQPELERYFLPRPEGWVPRPGVLVWDEGIA
jgi:hypothetical protein